MNFVLNAQQMKDIEEKAFALGMPVAALMEKAALKVVHRINELYPLASCSSVGFIVGRGHNGADALVVARELFLRGRQIKLLICGEPRKELTENHFKYLKFLAGEDCLVTSVMELKTCDLIVDGLFGCGLNSQLNSTDVRTIEELNHLSKTVVAIDLPSGVDSTEGKILGAAVKATRTFCLGAWKESFLCTDALHCFGEIELLDLGLSKVTTTLFPLAPQENAGWEKNLFLKRDVSSHKYSVGRGLLVAGSDAFPGAAVLCAKAALEAGVGYLNVSVPESLIPILAESTPDAVPTKRETGMDLNVSAILCGPGLGEDVGVVREIVTQATCPVVLDASAVTLFRDEMNLLKLAAQKKEIALTPHSGEFSRTFPEAAKCRSPLRAAQMAASESGCIVVLKGPRTIIAAPDGRTQVQMHSTPALARAGTGDVLAGLIFGLCAQKTDLFEACCSAVGWHSTAARDLALEFGEAHVSASTLLNSLKNWLRKNIVQLPGHLQ